jgi:hypothetical protein
MLGHVPACLGVARMGVPTNSGSEKDKTKSGDIPDRQLGMSALCTCVDVNTIQGLSSAHQLVSIQFQ